jgi:hypothetical protein
MTQQDPSRGDESADDDFDPEGPDPSEMDHSDDPDLEVCPHCRKLISEDAERCPHCGQFFSLEDEPLSRRAWILVGVVVVILIVLLVFRL